MKAISSAKLSAAQRRLAAAAVAAAETAYCPYSGISVGAAIDAGQGEPVTGSNVENAAYGASICAERAAVVRANAMGATGLRAIAVFARGRGLDRSRPVTPCGECRQVLAEFASRSGGDPEVILVSPDLSRAFVTTVSQLLPSAFTLHPKRKSSARK